MRRHRLLPVLCTLAALLVVEAAQAYVPSVNFVLRMLAEKRQRMEIRDLSIQLITEATDAEGPVEERLYLKAPERLRRIRQEEDGATVYVEREAKIARGTEGALKLASGPPNDPLPALLMPRGGDLDEMERRMVAALKAFGIDTAVVALGRFDGSTAYIIGARSFEPEKPQLWLDKESVLPLRMMVPAAAGRVEIRWLEFGSSVTNEAFPRVIEVWRDGKRVERSEVSKIELNKKVPETFFDLPQ